MPSVASEVLSQVATDKRSLRSKLLEEVKKEVVIAVVEPIEQGVIRIRYALNVDVYSLILGKQGNKLLVKFIVSSYRREIMHDTLVWIAVSGLVELDMQRVMSEKVVLYLNCNGKQKQLVLDIELAKRLVYVDGAVLIEDAIAP